MKFEIKHRYSGKILFSMETDSWKLAVEAAIKSYADLHSADLRSADLRSANLSYADLRYVDLHSANLHSANLRSANLRSANLSYANLSYADLHSAKNINKYTTTPLYLLLEQTGNIRAYKLVKENGEGPFNGGVVYEIGKTYIEKNANTDEKIACAEGINLATLDWCIKGYREGYKILIAEFTSSDIAAIPLASDGKFRVRKCKIVGEKNLQEIGLIEKEEVNYPNQSKIG